MQKGIGPVCQEMQVIGGAVSGVESTTGAGRGATPGVAVGGVSTEATLGRGRGEFNGN